MGIKYINNKLEADEHVFTIKRKLSGLTPFRTREPALGSGESKGSQYSYMLDDTGLPVFIDLGTQSDVFPAIIALDNFIDELINVTIKRDGATSVKLFVLREFSQSEHQTLNFIVGTHLLLNESLVNQLDVKLHFKGADGPTPTELGESYIDKRMNDALDAVSNKVEYFEQLPFDAIRDVSVYDNPTAL